MMEGVRLNLGVVLGSTVAQRLNVAGGLVTGPLYGVLGQRWRTRRSWVSAALAASPLLLEPMAGALGWTYAGDAVASGAEVGAGVLLAVVFAVAISRSRRPRALHPISTWITRSLHGRRL
jgi:hypothetical protein